MKNKINGLKTYCSICRKESPKCNHKKIYRARIHVPGTKSSVRTMVINSEKYEDAVFQFLNFKRQLSQINFLSYRPQNIPQFTTFIKSKNLFEEFLAGKGEYIQFYKGRSISYVKQVMSHINRFELFLKEECGINSKIMCINTLSNLLVSRFYHWREKVGLNESYFNKHIYSMRIFIDFVIQHLGVHMENPFSKVVKLKGHKNRVTSISIDEFFSILNCISVEDSYKTVGTSGHRKNMYFDQIKEVFKLILFTGGRLEEVVTLKWSDIHTIVQNNSTVYKIFFSDLKVNRIKRNTIEKTKSVIVHPDLLELLQDLGLDEKINTNDFIVCNSRNRNIKNFIDQVSKSFSYYRDLAGVRKEISIKHLRKTYISWINSINSESPHILTGHSSKLLLSNYYINPLILGSQELILAQTRITKSLL